MIIINFCIHLSLFKFQISNYFTHKKFHKIIRHLLLEKDGTDVQTGLFSYVVGYFLLGPNAVVVPVSTTVATGKAVLSKVRKSEGQRERDR